MNFPRRELGLALTCGGLLMLEICLTKIFSIVLWYHFGFLAVSTALLGFASSGVYLALKHRQVVGPAADGPIARSAAVASLMAMVSLWLVTQTSFDVYSLVQDRTIGTLLAFVLWVTLPFYFLGLVISRTLSAFPERANILYGADLVGSAIGCFAAVLILSKDVSGQATILLASIAIGLGGVMFAGRRIVTLTACLLATAVPIVLLSMLDAEQVFPLRSPQSKPYYRIESMDKMRGAAEKPLLRRGIVTMKDGRTLEVEVTDPFELIEDGTGVWGWTDDGERVAIRFDEVASAVGRDGLAFEIVPWSPYRLWSSMSRVDAFHWPAEYGPWGLWGLSDEFQKSGSGATPRQKGVTIDAWAMTSMMRYSGKAIWPAGTPDVDAERAKLRVLEYLPASTVHRLFPEGADKIVCIGAGGGLDLMTAKYFGAKQIDGVEINKGVVYATRQFGDFVGHLYDPSVHPDVEVHIAEGRHFIERSDEKFDVVQLSGVDTFSTTESGAFSLSENYLYTVEAFRSFLGHLEPEGVLTLTRWFLPHYVPGPADDPGADSIEPRYSLRLLATTRQALEESGVANPAASMFFLLSKGFTVILAKPVGFTESDLDVLHAHCEKYGYQVLFSPRGSAETLVSDARGGVIEVDNPLPRYATMPDLQRELRDYRFDVEPTRDDRPFFFEVSRFEDILSPGQFVNPLGGFTAHGLLLVLLAEVLLLGLLFVIWPLRRLAQDPFPGGRRVRAGALIYFTALGFGFIVVEIILAQKFVLFLGHPIYSLAVILFSMLLFSGIGAMLAFKFPLPRFATWLAAGLALVPVYLFPIVFERFLGESIELRIAISVGILAPIGLAMGIPFPVGLRVLHRVRPTLIPWAWAINGYTSVLGTVLAVILALELGFTVVLFIAAGVYALGVLGYSLMAIPQRQVEQQRTVVVTEHSAGD